MSASTMPKLQNNTLFIDSIVAELNVLAGEIHNNDIEVNNLRFKLFQHTTELETIESRIRVEVAFDTNLKNEKQRDAATYSLRHQDEGWVALTQTTIPELKHNITKLEADRSFNYRKYQTLLAYVKSMGSDE